MNAYVGEVFELGHFHNSTGWLRKLLDAKYENSYLNKGLKSNVGI